MDKIDINLHKILRSRIKGWKGRMIPGFMITGLEKLVHQDELNAALDATYPSTGSEFCERIYDFFNVTLEVEGLENIPEHGRFIFASNHPLGGLDGMGLIKVLGAKYGDENIQFLVNDMLMNVIPLRTVFLPINKYGSQAREAAVAIRDAYASDKQILIFPAGMVSRIQPDGSIGDLVWHKSFIDRAIEFHRDIIPIHFEGLNRMSFYRTAKARTKMGIKVNMEQALLPAELCAARGKTFRVRFGKPISWQSLENSGEPHALLASKLRRLVHSRLTDYSGIAPMPESIDKTSNSEQK